MLYGKLPVVFLSTIVSEKSGSTNSVIASFILDNINNIETIGIKELASNCNVAVSSVSRFCKEIGLRDFEELKELLRKTNLKFDQYSDKENINLRISDYGEKVKESIDMVTNSIDSRKISRLCKDIKKYKNVAAFGMLKAETAAINLQGDMLMMSKQIYTKVPFNEQMNYIKNAGEEDLIIIFSYTGVYFDYQYRHIPESLVKPKIYFITAEKKQYHKYIDEVITFNSKEDQGSHPYQLQYVASLIAQEYSNQNNK